MDWREAECNSDNKHCVFYTFRGRVRVFYAQAVRAAASFSGACSVEDEDSVALLLLIERGESCLLLIILSRQGPPMLQKAPTLLLPDL